MTDHQDESTDEIEHSQPVTPPRTFVNAGMQGTYIPTWTQVRDGADDNQRYLSLGNRT